MISRSPRTCSLQLHRQCAEPDLACRYHLCRDRSGLALHPSTVLHFTGRKIVGWAMCDHLRADLPLAVFGDGHLGAAARCRPIHHSDRGVQYASADYRKVMQSAGFRASMSRKADCYDNAPMESFFHTLKTELVHHRQYATREEANVIFFTYIKDLQSNASSFRHRLYQPDRDGAKSSLTLPAQQSRRRRVRATEK